MSFRARVISAGFLPVAKLSYIDVEVTEGDPRPGDRAVVVDDASLGIVVESVAIVCRRSAVNEAQLTLAIKKPEFEISALAGRTLQCRAED